MAIAALVAVAAQAAGAMLAASGHDIICRSRLSGIRPGSLPVDIATGHDQDDKSHEQQDPYVFVP